MESELLWEEMQEICQGDTELMQNIIDDLQFFVNGFIESEGQQWMQINYK